MILFGLNQICDASFDGSFHSSFAGGFNSKINNKINCSFDGNNAECLCRQNKSKVNKSSFRQIIVQI